MKSYVVLLRGVNVGGKNKLPMKALKAHLEALGYKDVATYIASGNVLLRSAKTAKAVRAEIEESLPREFKFEGGAIRALVLTGEQLRSVISARPKGFGGEPQKYHSDVIFLLDVTAARAMPAFSPREGVDAVWPGDGVVYSRRLSARRTQSRLNRVMASPVYQSMTIRNWNTVTKLGELLEGRAS